MKTFNKELKTKLIAEIKKHMEADQIIQGTYGKEEGGKWRGCAVGCSIRSLNLINGTDIDSEDHEALAQTLGTTPQLHHLEDKIFEGLPKEKATQWPLRFTEALPEEKDVSLVVPKFMIWIGEEMKQLVEEKSVHEVWDTVIALYQKVINGGTVTDEGWLRAAEAAEAARAAAWAAAGAAWAAAWASAWAAAGAARAAEAAEAAWAAAWAAAGAARAAEAAEAAWAAAGAAAGAARAAEAAEAAEAAFYEKMADKLIELLEECKSS